MALTKETVVDQVTVTESGIVLYREATRIMEDGNQISQTYHRTSLTPGQDLTSRPANVVAICNAVWTPEVIATYEAQQARLAAEMAAQQAAAEKLQTVAPATIPG
jgi:DNA-binding transcriptional LysR family regulator